MKNYKLPPGYNFLHSLWRTYKQVHNPVGTMEESMATFNGTYAVNLGMTRLIATQDPGLIDHILKTNNRNYHKSPIQTDSLGKFLGKGLLTANGDYWLRQRRLIQPGFHMDKIHALYGIIQKTVTDFLSTFPVGKNIDVYPLMHKLAFEIVINSLFTVDVPVAQQQALSEFINEVQAFVIKDLRQPYKSWWFSLSGEVKRNLKRAEGARHIIRTMIHERRKSTHIFNDLLDMLLAVRYEDTGDSMHEDQVIDEILIVLIAGHETTANALSWTMYLLANHPVALVNLRQSTMGINLQECVTHDGLTAVIKESMRLYPPAWISDRVALNDDTYGDFRFPKGSIIILFYYGLHRDKKYWEDATAFKPERFKVKSADKDKPKAYYPFGAGPRLCIGNNFAMAEMAIFLQTMIHSFTISPTNVTPAIKPLITLRPDRVVLDIERIVAK